MKRLLHVIADYAPMSQEFGEILQRIWTQNWDLDLEIIPTSIPSLDTIGTGYLAYQLGLGENPPGTVLYINTAPRKERKTAMNNNAGERLVWARLSNEVELVAVNSGYSLSFLRPHIEELRAVEVSHSGSQFRSRDFFPPVVSDILHGRHDARLREPMDLSVISDYPEDAVMWTDGFGNIKTTLRRDETMDTGRFVEGAKVHVAISGMRAAALVTGGSFSVDEGELALSVGSSGHDNPFLEIFLRGGSAADLFGHPRPGARVEITD
ncbi:MAG: hypothetical protein EA383_11500 [Spirochaetaceae bacterium]|nr:MAG: hypothetical protein EA383_11500 [Spirochaetaceae bacterium]